MWTVDRAGHGILRIPRAIEHVEASATTGEDREWF
jgi:hypothetical protein